MVLDSSAIVAIHLKEPGYERIVDILGGAVNRSEAVAIGTPTLLETTMVLSARIGKDTRPLVSAFVQRIGAEVIAFQQEHLDAAASAFLRFGRGRHRAALNFGDCMAYAVASVSGMPLLFTGDDFSRTDITAA
jgi:ribonuclease VapC